MAVSEKVGMLDMDNVVFSEFSTNIKDEFEDENYLDDKVSVSETAVNMNTLELNEYISDNEIKLDPISTDIKLEKFSASEVDSYNNIINDKVKIEHGVADFIKVEFNNQRLLCNDCYEYYEEYCTKCGMLICILNRNNVNNVTRKDLPRNILEIRIGSVGDIHIFALRTIPKGVKFGPFTGLISESSWKLKGGKFVVTDDKSEFLNWMQYINSATSISKQNLYAFQYENSLYYRSIREIQKGEELLIYFGEEYEESVSKGVEMDFIPIIEEDVKNVFACTFCCLGFSLKAYLAEHKTVCCNGTNGEIEELVQCPFCRIYLEKKEYLECHEIYCSKGNARKYTIVSCEESSQEYTQTSISTIIETIDEANGSLSRSSFIELSNADKKPLESPVSASKRKKTDPTIELISILKENATYRKGKREEKKVSQITHNQLDDVEMFYMSMAKIAKRLPKIEEARLRQEVCRFVSDAEIKNLKSESWSRSTSSASHYS